MQTLYFEKRKKLYVLKYDENNKPYMFVYDMKNVFVNNKDEICCIKCLKKLKHNFKREMNGSMWCEDCQEEKGNFENWGFAQTVRAWE